MPRTLAQNAQYIAETIKPAIKSAIEAQGVTVPSTDSFLDYADRIGEIEGGGSGYQLKDLPSGSISTVTDAAPLPLNALKVSVEAWQEGSGDPSPSNIRPIHGWDSGEITISATGDFYNSANTIRYNNNSEVTINSANSITVKSLSSGTYRASRQNLTEYSLVVGEHYKIESDAVITSGTAVIAIRNNSNLVLAWSDVLTTNGHLELEFDYTNDMTRLAFFATWGDSEDGNITYKNIKFYKCNTQRQVDFPQTIYGAEWDVVGGELKQTDGYIASYNGETLPSSWISDRDVYASGTTPTIGAEVVYKLATPTTIQLSPLSIRLLEGTNNVYADCGEVLEGEYFVDEGAHRYQLYDYIESDGTQVIDTGRQVVSGQTVKTVFHPMSDQIAYAWLFGSGDTSHYYGYQLPQQTTLLEYNGSTGSSGQMSVSTADENVYNLAFTASDSLALNYYVFGIDYSETPGGNNLGKFRLYSISVNGDSFLPCKRKSDGVFGLYDVANKAFLTDSAGGNAFVGGNPTGVEV